MILNRASIAAHYLTGRGLEVGALHSPLEVPPGVEVRYADFEDGETLDQKYPELEGQEIKRPDILTKFETLSGVDDASQDFLIANHVLEHCEDPIGAVKSVARVLRPGGVAYMAVPDRRFTFDSERPVTPIEHLVRDHEEGPQGSLEAHYREWIRLVDKLDGKAADDKLARMLEKHANIHFHVWEHEDMLKMFHHLVREMGVPLQVELSFLHGCEVIWILRRANP